MLLDEAGGLTAVAVLWLLLAHLLGDYVIQNDWMAVEKTRRWWPALVHGATYGIPFMLVVPSVWAWLVITGTHAVIDRYRLARHLLWMRNQLAPRAFRYRWRDRDPATAMPPRRPVWLGTFVMIAIDNTVHLVINLGAVVWL